MSEDRFEQLLNEMRAESAQPEEFEAAKARVWEKLSQAESAVCAEFSADLSAYAKGSLTDARRLLVEDHLSRCPACRRAMAEERGQATVVTMPAAKRRPLPQWSRWAMAAGVALVLLYAGRDRIDSALAPSGPRATIETVDGSLYKLTAGPLAKGAALNEGDVVRTGPGAHAVLRLADGSTVEMNERTELWVHAAWSGQTVNLDRGDVIVQAAKQRRGHLRVRTRDAVASVKGTVFAVTSGTAGSLVSVVEGSVEVSQPGSERLLTRGQQTATGPSLAAVPIRQAIAWSPEAERYYEILGVLAQVEKELASDGTAFRTQSRLLALLPPNVVFYGAIPNLGGAVTRAVSLIEQRAQNSAALREWWESGAAEELKTTLNKVQAIAPTLGEEIVFVVAKNPSGTGDLTLVLAEVRDGRETALREQLDPLLVRDGASVYRIANGVLTVSDSPAHLQAILPLMGGGSASELAAELGRRYTRGVGWLFAFDATTVKWSADTAAAEGLGFKDVKFVTFEQRASGAGDENEASISFSAPRRGVASWLAEPASSGSDQYATTGAVAVVSASTRNPRQAFDELVTLMSSLQPKFADSLREFEAKSGVNLGDDIASALGTDFTFVLEKPAIPLPEWVAAMEVYKPIDGAVRTFVESVNSQIPADQQQYRLTIFEEEVSGRRWMGLKSGGFQVTLWWTYDRGYLVLSTDRAVAMRAIATRNGGFPLVHSAIFQQQLPVSGGLHNSGFVWVNTQGALSELAGTLQAGSLKTLLENRNPVLIALNAERERIRAVSRTRLTSVVLDLLMMHGPGSREETGQTAGNATNAASN